MSGECTNAAGVAPETLIAPSISTTADELAADATGAGGYAAYANAGAGERRFALHARAAAGVRPQHAGELGADRSTRAVARNSDPVSRLRHHEEPRRFRRRPACRSR